MVNLRGGETSFKLSYKAKEYVKPLIKEASRYCKESEIEGLASALAGQLEERSLVEGSENEIIASLMEFMVSGQYLF